MKTKDLQPRLLYPAKLLFKTEGEISSFPDKKKLKEFVNTKPVLQQMLKGLLKKTKRKKERRKRGWEEEEGKGGGGETTEENS